ncbi:MAG TPA: bifunctional nuclease family protein [Candidatus Methylomirabilis sp.]|nr:bifunctional nuclease family protein [Candidatus Methylomirabilis sp.]
MGHFTRLARLALLLVIGAGLVGARDQGPAPPGKPTGPQEVTVLGLLVDDRTQQPTIVLQGKRDGRTFAMVIGPAEATGIAIPLQKLTPPRPLTHDLFLTLFGRLNVTVSKVVITDLRDNTYYATLFLSAAGTPMELDSRPSDAIALAVRAKAPIYAEDRVFEKADRLPLGPESGPRI